MTWKKNQCGGGAFAYDLCASCEGKCTAPSLVDSSLSRLCSRELNSEFLRSWELQGYGMSRTHTCTHTHTQEHAHILYTYIYKPWMQLSGPNCLFMKVLWVYLSVHQHQTQQIKKKKKKLIVHESNYERTHSLRWQELMSLLFRAYFPPKTQPASSVNILFHKHIQSLAESGRSYKDVQSKCTGGKKDIDLAD